MAIEQTGERFAAVISVAADQSESFDTLSKTNETNHGPNELSHPQQLGPSVVNQDDQVNGQLDAGTEVEAFFDLAVQEMAALRTRAEVDAIEAAASLILGQEKLGGRVHFTGIGKSEHIARYAASLLSSTGTPAYFLHATECVHGSAGQVRNPDIVIAISNSGSTPELLHAIDAVKEFGVKVISITGQPQSLLSEVSEVILYAGVENEGGVLNLVPRASILAKIYVLSALSVSLEVHKGLTREQYAQWHPSGALGRKARGE